MKKHDMAPARIERTVAIANLTKKRHSKLSFSQFHKFIIDKIAEKEEQKLNKVNKMQKGKLKYETYDQCPHDIKK
ncbi:hypothetical protein LOD59_09480 [Xylella fastidiosa subsp. multiplex]|uniref:hypothetical protein n=1 Tax=Xylella fastidiosa TaxID=2371 RepID=UPI00235F4944|nr:hypothetical protein [Xylella fastidiosa]MDD0927853.1 hypothetical protein [Xylella fastidiosa subsp. multiplex]